MMMNHESGEFHLHQKYISSNFISKYSLLEGDMNPYIFICIPSEGTREEDDTTRERVIHIRPTPTHPQPLADRLDCWCVSSNDVVVVSLWNHHKFLRNLQLYRPFVISSLEDSYKMEIEIYNCKYKTRNIIKASPRIASHGLHDMVVYVNKSIPGSILFKSPGISRKEGIRE
ncbi:hypothetical protein FEM48_Zijuj09G0165100 [Ziziphus jujuba var. spinosa]|uniref:Uncharacterized protein n=1 Tax=Ziziphus jujuba var. spinosa TaxID=714518 RepID=A0A978UU25_ZIZJJ|nr:hypothetical protein FEM48_Zijuj09G0165100 [Ziziphus jujuba var. spinosa]